MKPCDLEELKEVVNDYADNMDEYKSGGCVGMYSPGWSSVTKGATDILSHSINNNEVVA